MIHDRGKARAATTPGWTVVNPHLAATGNCEDGEKAGAEPKPPGDKSYRGHVLDCGLDDHEGCSEQEGGRKESQNRSIVI
jgi:hypothetical protein